MDSLLLAAATVPLAVALDLVVGDPEVSWHPVRLLGRFAGAVERHLRASRLSESLDGILLAAVVVASASGLAWALSFAAHLAGPVVGLAVDALLIAIALAGRSLAEAGAVVGRALARGDLAEARLLLARIVGRDTERLGETGIARATIETLAENTVDAVVAPLFWAALLGPAGIWAHKAASTLDSMVGYKDERNLRIGAMSARLDDVLVWVPARLAVPLIALSSALLGLDASGALRVGGRDRLLHASPNSAHGEAAFAGALRVRLGGEVCYRGRVSHRPDIGSEFSEALPERIGPAARLVVAVEVVGAVVAFGATVLRVLVIS